MAEKRTCPKCGGESWSANTIDIMKCPYCGAELPVPEVKDNG